MKSAAVVVDSQGRLENCKDVLDSLCGPGSETSAFSLAEMSALGSVDPDFPLTPILGAIQDSRLPPAMLEKDCLLLVLGSENALLVLGHIQATLSALSRVDRPVIISIVEGMPGREIGDALCRVGCDVLLCSCEYSRRSIEGAFRELSSLKLIPDIIPFSRSNTAAHLHFDFSVARRVLVVVDTQLPSGKLNAFTWLCEQLQQLARAYTGTEFTLVPEWKSGLSGFTGKHSTAAERLCRNSGIPNLSAVTMGDVAHFDRLFHSVDSVIAVSTQVVIPALRAGKGVVVAADFGVSETNNNDWLLESGLFREIHSLISNGHVALSSSWKADFVDGRAVGEVLDTVASFGNRIRSGAIHPYYPGFQKSWKEFSC